MSEVDNKQLAKWTKRWNGDAIWDTKDGCSYMGICGAGNASGADIKDKRCKRRQKKWLSGEYYPEGVCIGHYGLPYPNRCPLCNSRKRLNTLWDDFNIDIGCESCGTIVVNYMLDGVLVDYSNVIPDYKDAVKQLFGVKKYEVVDGVVVLGESK